MQRVKKILHTTNLKISIIGELFKTLWKYKLWWSLPVVFILLFFMLFLLIIGHSGIAALIYPLF